MAGHARPRQTKRFQNCSECVQDDELDEMLDEDDEVGELSGGLAAVALAATRKELTYQV